MTYMRPISNSSGPAITRPPARSTRSAAPSAVSTLTWVIQPGAGGGSKPGAMGAIAATSRPRSCAVRNPPPSTYSQPSTAP